MTENQPNPEGTPDAQAEAEQLTGTPEAATFSEIEGTRAAAGQSASLNTLLDVTLPVTIEFGRTRMTVQEILELGVGSVVQLDRMVGEPVDLFVGDQKLAEGEVVVIGEHFGIRVTKILEARAAVTV